MIEYVSYKLICLGKVYNFENINEAIKCKRNMIQEIKRGKYDEEIEKRVNIYDYILTENPNSIEDNRKYAIQSLDLLKVYNTPSGIEKRNMRIKDDGSECPITGPKIIIEPHLGEKYIVFTERKDDKMYIKGGMICSVCPWMLFNIPLKLSICICPDGGILHRGWDWSGSANYYLHTSDKPQDINVTIPMIDTVSGLFSGRILFEGLKIQVGRTVQDICPINLKKEEELLKKKIYLA